MQRYAFVEGPHYPDGVPAGLNLENVDHALRLPLHQQSRGSFDAIVDFGIRRLNALHHCCLSV
jgi:hypothetical protein